MANQEHIELLCQGAEAWNQWRREGTMTSHLHFPNRVCTVWQYTTSHRQLVLRSVKNSEQGTRIDILFKPVAWMSLPADFSDLTIEAASPDQVDAMTTTSGVVLQSEMDLFVLRGKDTQGYAAAALYAVDESTREYDEPDIWGTPPFFPFYSTVELVARTPEQWRQLGYSSGTRLRKALPDTDEIFLHHVIKDCLLGAEDWISQEYIDAFFEGMKSGYMHPQDDNISD